MKPTHPSFFFINYLVLGILLHSGKPIKTPHLVNLILWFACVVNGWIQSLTACYRGQQGKGEVALHAQAIGEKWQDRSKTI